MRVVIPVYNGAHILPRTIPAVLSLAADSIVYVNDGSTDATREVLTATQARDPRVEVVSLAHNLGRASARNAGASGGEEDVLLFLDADVAPHPGYAESLRDALQSAEAVAAIARIDYAELDPEEPYARYVTSNRRGVASGARGPIPWRHFLSGVAAIRRTAFEAAGGFPESIRYGEDLAFACRLAQAHPDGLVLSDALATLYDIGTLQTVLDKLASFAADLPRVLDTCPDALETSGLLRLGDRRLHNRALIRVLRSHPPAALVFRMIPHLPRGLQPLAVRYLLAHTLAVHTPTDGLASAA